MKYLVIVTPTETGFTARVPDVEGCISTGRTPDLVERRIRAALEFHITDLRQRGETPPTPKSYVTHVESVAATLEMATVN